MAGNRTGTAACAVLLLSLPRAGRAQEPLPLTLVPGEDTGCPSRTELVAALERQGFRLVDPGAAPLFLEVRTAQALTVELRDGAGKVLVYRVFERQDCSAVAETIALVVWRRVDELGEEGATEPDDPVPVNVPVPAREPEPEPERPPPPAERGWALDAAAGLLVANGIDTAGFSAGPALAATLEAPALLAAGLSAGWVRHLGIPAGNGALDLDRLLLGAFAGVGTRGSRLELHALARLEPEVVWTRTRGIEHPMRQTFSALRAGAAAAAGVRIAGGFWAGLSASALLLLRGVEMVVEDPVARHSTLAFAATATLGYRLEI